MNGYVGDSIGQTKTCTHCGQAKLLTEFPVSGLWVQSICRDCRNMQSAALRRKKRNKLSECLSDGETFENFP